VSSVILQIVSSAFLEVTYALPRNVISNNGVKKLPGARQQFYGTNLIKFIVKG
jgi:hypothetical protein